MLEEIVNARRSADTNKRKKVRCSNHPAFVLFVGAVLNQSIDGDSEETGREAKGGEQYQHMRERQISGGKQDSEQGHADGAERNQSVFDFAARKITRREAAEADADRDCSLQYPRARGGAVQHVLAIEDDIGRQQRAQKPEICVTENRQPENAI